MPNGNVNKTHCKRGHEFTKENTRENKDGSRTCKTCQVERDFQSYLKRHGKELEEINRRIDRTEEERKERKVLYGKEYRKLNPDTRDNKERNVKARHGLSAAQYDARRKAQKLSGDLCGVCRKLLVENPKPNLDHDHNTGQLREFLHVQCNMALGLI
jgi:hypothetical protein